MVEDHGEMSSIFWQEFKWRLGSSVGVTIQFNLQDLVQRHHIDFLCLPFSSEEVDGVILDLPYDKASGPDGFNNLFFKKSWHIIRETCTSSSRIFSIIRLISRASTILSLLWFPRKIILNL
jgi:hypothetical protein